MAMDRGVALDAARVLAVLAVGGGAGWTLAVWQLERTGVVPHIFAAHYIDQGLTLAWVAAAFLAVDACWVGYQRYRAQGGDVDG